MEFLVILYTWIFWITWGPVTWGWPIGRVPLFYMHWIHIIWTELRSAIQFNICTRWAMYRTTVKPQLNPSLLHSNSLKFQLQHGWPHSLLLTEPEGEGGGGGLLGWVCTVIVYAKMWEFRCRLFRVLDSLIVSLHKPALGGIYGQQYTREWKYVLL